MFRRRVSARISILPTPARLKDDRKYSGSLEWTGDSSEESSDDDELSPHEDDHKAPDDNEDQDECNFRRPTAGILDTAPINVYEELSEDAYDEAGNLVVDLASCAFEGGLFKERAPYIKTAHLIYPSEAQLLNAKRLHHTCHYSISREQLPEFLETARKLDVPVEHYHRNQSYYFDPDAFINVYNYGTDGFDKIEPLFNELAFERTAKAISQEYKTEKRGNIQGAFGVSSLSMNKRNSLGVAVPQFNSSTSKQVDNFLVMSELSKATHTYEKPTQQSIGGQDRPNNDYFQRFQEEEQSAFAQAIDEDNIHEGLTDGGYLEWARLFTHCDVHNCFLQHRNGVIICSRVVMEKTKDPSSSGGSRCLWSPRRLIVIAYMRKVVSDFAKRQSRHAPVVALVKNYYFNEIPKWRRDITCDFVTDGWDEVLEGGILSRPCNMDKLGWYAPFIDALHNFIGKFQPSLEDLCDVGVLIPGLSESAIFPSVLNYWVEQGKLPEEGCLAEAFADTAVELFGSFACGPCPRKQTCLRSVLDKASNDKSKRILYNEVVHLNEEVEVSETSTKSQASIFSASIKRLSRKPGGLYYTKEIGAQHLLVIFAGAGIIHHPCFLAQAMISTKTETAKRLRERFGLSDKDFPILLQAIAHALGISPQKAENVLCEALRSWQKMDLYIPGQWLYRLTDARVGVLSSARNDHRRYVVERFNPLDKSVAPEMVPDYSPTIAPKGEEKWRAFSKERPASSFRTMSPHLVRKKRAFKSVYFRSVQESVDYIRSAQRTLFDLESRQNLFTDTHSRHPLATNDRSGKKKAHHAFFLEKLQRADDEWCDLVCRLRPFARYVNEDRLSRLGLFTEKTMRAWVDRPLTNRRRGRAKVLVESPSEFRPQPLKLDEADREHVRRVKRRITEAVSGSNQEGTGRLLFTEKDRLTGNEHGRPEINTADILGWVFDSNEPRRIAEESVANGFKATPSLFGARVYRPRGMKAMPGLTTEEASDDLRSSAAASIGAEVGHHFGIKFDRENIGGKLFKALTNHSAWKYPPTLAEWSRKSYSIKDFLHSPASCPRTNMAHLFDLGMLVRSLVGRFRVHYLEINGFSGGRSFAAFLERVEAPSTCDTKRIVLGSLPEAGPEFKYAHPRGLVRSLSGTKCMGAMTPPDFYENKTSARTALFFYILLNFVGEDPLVRFRTVKSLIFRKYAKSSVLANAHTPKSNDDVCSCMFHVDNGKAFILLPPSSTEDGGSEQGTELARPLVLPL